MTTPQNTDPQNTDPAGDPAGPTDTFVPGEIDAAIPAHPDLVEGTEADVDAAQAAAFGVGEENDPAPPGPNSPPVDENNAPLDPDAGLDPEAGDDLDDEDGSEVEDGAP